MVSWVADEGRLFVFSYHDHWSVCASPDGREFMQLASPTVMGDVLKRELVELYMPLKRTIDVIHQTLGGIKKSLCEVSIPSLRLDKIHEIGDSWLTDLYTDGGMGAYISKLATSIEMLNVALGTKAQDGMSMGVKISNICWLYDMCEPNMKGMRDILTAMRQGRDVVFWHEGMRMRMSRTNGDMVYELTEEGYVIRSMTSDCHLDLSNYLVPVTPTFLIIV